MAAAPATPAPAAAPPAPAAPPDASALPPPVLDNLPGPTTFQGTQIGSGRDWIQSFVHWAAYRNLQCQVGRFAPLT
jgi:hypothetical protein